MQPFQMTTDEWRDRVDHSRTIDEPAWDQVEQAIIRLDGKVRTIVTLSQSEDTYLMVCGQWNNLYMVNASVDNRNFFSLVDLNRSAKKSLFLSAARMAILKRKNAFRSPWRWMPPSTIIRPAN